eukprot:CAMPEP_0198107984 /NCGR_PEP_ID=MMETSP1442-20131203/70_1 /TAXON_ID= /ORGANISM="Craspedostauros australis, Strain CCMP3328" /LENGTH=80 /DNA_ID=CAMNT_0043763163 /DNA_START=740 /DNA_END=982 /DNA_ORIENTATION=+
MVISCYRVVALLISRSSSLAVGCALFVVPFVNSLLMWAFAYSDGGDCDDTDNGGDGDGDGDGDGGEEKRNECVGCVSGVM